ncbi:maleylpyruvate isomerase family mycothiol-dependent enzyme [Micromonospora sp. NPDC005298]|uniref:maleylpyruvate isomerase family mycothiol-dependent enzyme n=1 Tax=Micromonospora sp. NPDC005298 TaxID=3156873 RepID=UPI0033A71AF6
MTASSGGVPVPTATELMAMISDERRRAADLVDTLTPAQLDTPSLCGAWTVRQVAAHLVAPFAARRRWFLPILLRSRLNLHEANARLAEMVARRPADQIAALLRANAETPYRVPRVGYFGQLTDLQVHGQDIRRPLGLPHELRPDRLRTSLDFLVDRRALGFFVSRGLTTGLRFEATDIGWASGAGRVVRGEAEAVMLALTGRRVVLAELSGDGVPVLRDRLTR